MAVDLQAELEQLRLEQEPLVPAAGIPTPEPLPAADIPTIGPRRKPDGPTQAQLNNEFPGFDPTH